MIVVNVDEVPVTVTDTGTRLRVLLDTTQDGQGRLSLAMETFSPGQRNAAHWHTELEEIYYIVAGSGEMEIGQERRVVRAGDSILIPPNQVHCLRNTGEVDLRLLCPVAPPWHPDDCHLAEQAHA